MSIEHNSKCRERWLACAGAIAATALAASAVHAQVTQPNDLGVMSFPNVIVIHTPPAAADERAAAEPSAAGLRAFIDPATGRLTQNPTPAQLQDLAAAEAESRLVVRKAGGPPPTFRGPGQATRVTLDDSTLMYSVARRADNGDLETACVVSDDKALDFLAGRSEGLPPVQLKPATARPVK